MTLRELTSQGCNNPVILPRENNYKLLHACDMLSCNIGNYLIKRQSGRYMIVNPKYYQNEIWSNAIALYDKLF